MAKQRKLTRAKRAGPVDRYVGSRVRLRRHMLGLSQTELADALGLTFQQVQKYENGTNRVGASRLQQLAQALDTSPAWFFEDGEGAQTAPRTRAGRTVDAHIVAFMADSNAARLIQSWAGAPKDVRRAVADLVAAAAGKTGGELA